MAEQEDDVGRQIGVEATVIDRDQQEAAQRRRRIAHILACGGLRVARGRAEEAAMAGALHSDQRSEAPTASEEASARLHTAPTSESSWTVDPTTMNATMAGGKAFEEQRRASPNAIRGGKP